jgi:hypothetical protein
MQGTARLIFQPAEEGGAGGDVMVKEGVSSAASYAVHTCRPVSASRRGHQPSAGSPTLAYHVQEPLTVHRQHSGFMSSHKFPQASRTASGHLVLGAAGLHL